MTRRSLGRTRRSESGFTLIETVVAISLSVALIGSLVGAFLATQKSTTSSLNYTETAHDVRLSAGSVATDVQGAMSVRFTAHTCPNASGSSLLDIQLGTGGYVTYYFIGATAGGQILRVACTSAANVTAVNTTARSLAVPTQGNPAPTAWVEWGTTCTTGSSDNSAVTLCFVGADGAQHAVTAVPRCCGVGPTLYGPQVTQDPQDVTQPAGGTATFTAAAGGGPSPGYTWQYSTDGGSSWQTAPNSPTGSPGAIAGQVSSSYSFTVSSSQQGYQYRVVFTNSSGTVFSQTATLTVASTSADTCGYPNGAGRSSTAFNEDSLAKSIQMNGTSSVSMFATDENTMLLGVSSASATATPYQPSGSMALITAVPSGSQNVLSLNVSTPHSPIKSGDTLVLGYGTGTTLNVTSTIDDAAGTASSVSVSKFSTNSTESYPVGSIVVDSKAPSSSTTLKNSIGSGQSTNSITVNSLTAPMASGDTVTINGSVKVTVSAPALAGDTHVSVNSFKPGTTLPVGAPVVDTNPTSYGHVRLPSGSVGDTSTTTPPYDTSGRPQYPALFVTDEGLTSFPTSPQYTGPTSGDWQGGGSPQTPNDVFGTWVTGRFVNGAYQKSALPSAKNATTSFWNLGPGSDLPNGSRDFSSLGTSEGYGTEARWDVSALGLNHGHYYRFQVMLHDGDQNKAGGDAGELCVNNFLFP